MNLEAQDQPPSARRTEHCAQCGYDMAALPTEAECPECGSGLRMHMMGGRPDHDEFWQVFDARIRPVIRLVAAGGILAMAGVAAMMLGRVPQHPSFGWGFAALGVAMLLLLVAAPLWAGVIAALHSRRAWGPFWRQAMREHIMMTLGTVLVTVTGAGLVLAMVAAAGCVIWAR